MSIILSLDRGLGRGCQAVPGGVISTPLSERIVDRQPGIYLRGFVAAAQYLAAGLVGEIDICPLVLGTNDQLPPSQAC
jgi:hypothetical protein